MSLRFPYDLPDLTGAGDVPADSEPARGIHFNRLFREIAAIQATLGINPEGSRSTVLARYSEEIRTADGGFKKELGCEDDPSGNKRGCRRYLDSQWILVDTGSTQEARTTLKFGYTLFPEPPALIFGILRDDADGYAQGLFQRTIFALSEVAARIDVRTNLGAAPPANLDYRIAWMALSRNLLIFEENVAWAMQPVRTGSEGQ